MAVNLKKPGVIVLGGHVQGSGNGSIWSYGSGNLLIIDREFVLISG